MHIDWYSISKLEAHHFDKLARGQRLDLIPFRLDTKLSFRTFLNVAQDTRFIIWVQSLQITSLTKNITGLKMVWYLLEVGWRILWGFFCWWESSFWKCQSRAWWVDGGPLVWNDKHSALKLREFFIVWNLKWPHFRAEHHILAHSLPNAWLYFAPFVQINSNWKAVNTRNKTAAHTRTKVESNEAI